MLNQIAELLRLSNEAGKDKLIAFIHSITHDTSGKRERGERDMVDLCEVVVRYFYYPSWSHTSLFVWDWNCRARSIASDFTRFYRIAKGKDL